MAPMKGTGRGRTSAVGLASAVRAALVLAALQSFVMVPAAWAQAAPSASAPVAPQAPRAPVIGGAPWSSLTPAQQKALAPLQRDWAAFDTGQQAKWMDLAGRLPAMSEDEQQRVRARMVQWARMTPRERAQARAQFQEARQLSPQERQSRWEAYQALPEERRRELAESRQPPERARRPVEEGAGAKSSVVKPAQPTAPTTVAPSVVRGGPGATTRLVTVPEAPPLHQQTGVPKMPAIPGFVDGNTLLPKRGVQAAGVQPAEPASRPAPAK